MNKLALPAVALAFALAACGGNTAEDTATDAATDTTMTEPMATDTAMATDTGMARHRRRRGNRSLRIPPP